MKTIRVILLALSFAGPLSAQATYDIATFTPPSGWQRSDYSGFIQYQTSRSSGGHTAYCAISIFQSHPASGNGMQTFAAEWMRLIAQPLRTNIQPQVETKETPDGWSAVTGSANVKGRGGPVTVVLFTATGFGKVMSVVFNLTDAAFVPDIRNFLSSLTLKGGGAVAVQPAPQGPAPASPPAAAPSSGGGAYAGTGATSDYIYTIPEGWSGKAYPDGGIVYGSQLYSTGERCQISVFPMRKASGDLFADARNAYMSIFQVDPLANNAYPYPTAVLTRGTAAAGWPYAIIQRSIRGRIGEYGTLLGTRIMAAQLGQQVAIITSTGKDPLVSNCFGEVVHDYWPAFFYTIAFKNWTPAPQDALVPRRLAGPWITATASVGLKWTFAPNGRYASAAAAMTRTAISYDEILETTNAYFGDGAYKIHGDTLTMIHDSDKGNPRIDRFRIEQVSKDGGQTWTDQLCLLEQGNGDVCYKRDQIN